MSHGLVETDEERGPGVPAPSEGYPDPSPPTEPLPLLTQMPERAKQRRWTVLLRVFLALPLAIVVLAVGIAAFVCAVLGWFAALVTGRAPVFVRTIVTVLLRMTLRLEAYLYLLTDRFPPFSTHEMPEYGTRLAVPPATRLHRATVLFRLVLVIPASIALRLTGLGLQVVAFFMWFAVLITGWLPKPVHEVYQAFIRYELRLTAYVYLLVPTYPGELFGDVALPVPMLSPRGDVLVEYLGMPEPAPPEPASWMLVLGTGAKRLLVGTIVLGVGVAAALGVLDASIENHENLVQVNNQLVSNLDAFTATASKCQDLSCLEHADGVLSGQLGSFVSALRSSSHAGVSQNLVDEMVAAVQGTQHVTATLAGMGPSVAAYRGAVVRLHAEQSFTTLGRVQHQFVDAVNAARLG